MAAPNPVPIDRRTLLVGVDGSDTSWRAFFYALGQARRDSSEVIAVNVVPITVATTSATVAGCSALVEAGQKIEAEIDELRAQSDVDIRFETTVGDPAGSLVRLAGEHHADGIVIGASTTLAHRIFGSIAGRAVRNSPCPVTVVP
ncbi:MAG: universal stress protein [Corynebacteriales bacterium]|nr:universal stress protein [Mycobacteriales bacterium]